MKSVAIINNFFSNKWLAKADMFCRVQRKSMVWTTNHTMFDADLVEGSGIILINVIPSPFDNELHDYLLEKNILKKPAKFFTALLYVGHENSYITWHRDGKTPYASDTRAAVSIYLNESWESGWGGWFSWKEDGHKEVKNFIPEYNSAVMLLQDAEHCTTPVTPAAKEKRVSFQLFFDRESLNDEYFKD